MNYLVWDAGEDNTKDKILGYDIYHSKHKSAGYGRINRVLLKQTKFLIPAFLKNLNPSYFKVQALGRNGLRSNLNLSEPLELPGVIAFGKYFDGVVWIEPSQIEQDRKDKSKSPIYHSLTEALKKEPSDSIFIVDDLREKVDFADSVENGAEHKNIYYLDDLRFLNGHAHLALLSGVDKDSEIVVYFLCKAMDSSFEAVSLLLDENPEIEFIRRRGFRFTFQLIEGTHKKEIDGKLSTTPVLGYPIVSNNAIYIVWETGQNQKHKGVRIFRSEGNSFEDWPTTGQELFDGPGRIENIACDQAPTKNPDPSKSKVEKEISVYDDEPPPRKKETRLSPSIASPTLFTVVGGPIFEHKQPNGNLAYFYEDRDVKNNSSYTYKIYAYNESGTYSYPILINTSMDILPLYSNCKPVKE